MLADEHLATDTVVDTAPGEPAESDRAVATVPRFWLWLGAITLAGFLLRLSVILSSKDEAVGGDGWGYWDTANQNATGHWFLGVFTHKPDAIHPPAWTLLLTVWVKLGFTHFLGLQVLAIIVGTSTVALVGLAAREIAGERVALVAAGIAAVYAGLWLYERALLSETLLFPVVAIALLAAYRFYRKPTIRRAALLGALVGLLAMIRAEQILLVLLLVLPLILLARSVSLRTRLFWFFLAGLMTLVVVMPWTIYNLGRFQKPVFLSTQAGGAIADGNCSAVYSGPLIGWYNVYCTRPVKGDPSVADGHEFHIGFSYEVHHLGQVPVVAFAREGRAFGFWNPFQQTYLDNRWQHVSPIFGKPTSVWVYDLRLWSYWILVVPAVAGAVILRRRRVPIYPLLAFVAAVIITVSYNFGETRYRAAAEVSIVILAAVGVDAAIRWLTRFIRRRTGSLPSSSASAT